MIINFGAAIFDHKSRGVEAEDGRGRKGGLGTGTRWGKGRRPYPPHIHPQFQYYAKMCEMKIYQKILTQAGSGSVYVILE